MNYIKQLNAFLDFQDNNGILSRNAQLLYYLLMDQASKKFWKEYFPVPNSVLIQKMQNISRTQFNKARKELIEKGLIQIIHGTSTLPPKYKIIKLYKENTEKGTDLGTEVGTDLGTEVGTDLGTEVGTDLGTEVGTDLGTEVGTEKTDSSLYNKLYINKNKNKNKNININKTDIPEVEKNNQVNELNGINKEIASFRDEALKKALAENDKLEQEKQNNVDKSTTTSKAKDRKTKKTKKEPLFDKTELMNFFNDHRNRMKKLIKFSDNRVTAVNARIKEYSKEQVREVILKAEQSDFLNGLTGDGSWIANFDWLMKKSNFLKVLEGNYDNTQNPNVRYQNDSEDILWQMYNAESEVVV